MPNSKKNCNTCSGTRKDGESCNKKVSEKGEYCHHHKDQQKKSNCKPCPPCPEEVGRVRYPTSGNKNFCQRRPEHICTGGEARGICGWTGDSCEIMHGQKERADDAADEYAWQIPEAPAMTPPTWRIVRDQSVKWSSQSPRNSVKWSSWHSSPRNRVERWSQSPRNRGASSPWHIVHAATKLPNEGHDDESHLKRVEEDSNDFNYCHRFKDKSGCTSDTAKESCQWKNNSCGHKKDKLVKAMVTGLDELIRNNQNTTPSPSSPLVKNKKKQSFCGQLDKKKCQAEKGVCEWSDGKCNTDKKLTESHAAHKRTLSVRFPKKTID